MCRKAHGLAHCRTSFVDIHLFSVCRRSRKIRFGRTPIDKDVPTDYASIFPFSQYVETRCLSSTGGPHECSQRSRLNIAIYVAKKPARAVRDGNVIIDALPCKNAAVLDTKRVRGDCETF